MSQFDKVAAKVSIFGLGARTSTVNSGIFEGSIWSGLWFWLRVTAVSGTGGLRMFLQATDDDGNFANVNVTPSPIISTGTFQTLFYPGAQGDNAAFVQVVGVPFPWKFRMRVEHADASSYTYQLVSFFLP